jgi:hypothetical protein
VAQEGHFMDPELTPVELCIKLVLS